MSISFELDMKKSLITSRPELLADMNCNKFKYI